MERADEPDQQAAAAAVFNRLNGGDNRLVRLGTLRAKA
jgi:hypothetical protein